MWYALQIAVIGGTAYIYLSEVSTEKDVLHALFLGYVVSFFVTLLITGILDLKTRLIRSNKATLLPLNRGGHKKPDKLISVHR